MSTTQPYAGGCYAPSPLVASAVEGGHHVGNGRLSSEVSDPSQRPAAGTGGRGTASMSDISWIVTTVVTVYALVTGVFLVSENRSPQATWHGCSLSSSRQASAY